MRRGRRRKRQHTVECCARAPESNKEGSVWCVVNEHGWNPEGRKGRTLKETQLCHRSGRTVSLFIIFTGRASFLNYVHGIPSPSASKSCAERTGRPHAGPDGLHLWLPSGGQTCSTQLTMCQLAMFFPCYFLLKFRYSQSLNLVSVFQQNHQNFSVGIHQWVLYYILLFESVLKSFQSYIFA